MYFGMSTHQLSGNSALCWVYEGNLDNKDESILELILGLCVMRLKSVYKTHSSFLSEQSGINAASYTGFYGSWQYDVLSNICDDVFYSAALRNRNNESQRLSSSQQLMGLKRLTLPLSFHPSIHPPPRMENWRTWSNVTVIFNSKHIRTDSPTYISETGRGI